MEVKQEVAGVPGSYRTWPVLPLHVSESVHDEGVAVLVGGVALQAGVRRLGDLGGLTPRPAELLQPGAARCVQHDAAHAARRASGLLVEVASQVTLALTDMLTMTVT